MFTYDVCIVGTGRVGLPLGLSFMEAGLKAVGLDVHKETRDIINAGKMPFVETGYDELVAKRTFVVTDETAVIAQTRVIVITVGTPLHSHIESDISQVRNVLGEISAHLRPGQLLCLRSTVAPGTTTYVQRWIEKNTTLKIGVDLGLAFCPERIAEGYAYKELRTLPQIIGAEDALSREKADEIFSCLAPENLFTNFVGAELIKLFNNVARYINFAIANQFSLVSENFGVDIYEIRRLANYKYPRATIAMPGLAAGSCLRKDFGMINEWTPYPDLLLSAWKINEYTPMFLVQSQKRRASYFEQKVAILGYSFKHNSDDTRDSLVPKLMRYIERELPSELRVSDYNLPDPIPDEEGNGMIKNWQAAEACRGADCVFAAVDHSGYRAILEQLAMQSPKTWVVDIWNIGGIEKIFYRAGDLVSS